MTNRGGDCENSKRHGTRKSWCRAFLFSKKLGEVFLGLARLVFGFIHVKKTALSVNTPWNISGKRWT